MQSVEAACTSAGLEIEQLMSRLRQADSLTATALVETLSPQLYRPAFEDLVAALPESQREC